MTLFTIEDIVRILLQGKNGHSINGLHEVLIEISKDIKIIQKQNQSIMANITELTQKVDALQTQVTDLTEAVNTEQQQITDAINALNQTVTELQAIIADGGTTEQRQALSDKLTQISTNLQTAKDDLASTIADATPVEPPVNGDQPGTSGGTL
jgi:ABC-type transporter Mla subunit MlaD